MWHRTPSVAGSFYPSNRKELERIIDEYLHNADVPELDGEVLGLVSPHAGYVYSGPIAAYSFKHLKKSGAEVVVVLAPSHRARFDGASVFPEGIYETPLGDVEVDSAIGNVLNNEPGFGFIKEAHQQEHSLEVQVPFIQVVLDNFKIVPIIVGTTDLKICNELAGSISRSLSADGRRFVIIISTDLSHYNPYDSATKIDNLFIESLKSFDENEVKNVLDSRKAEACGEGPVLTGMVACKKLGAERVEILKYANSGDTAGDKSQVVGYLSAAFIK